MNQREAYYEIQFKNQVMEFLKNVGVVSDNKNNKESFAEMQKFFNTLKKKEGAPGPREELRKVFETLHQYNIVGESVNSVTKLNNALRNKVLDNIEEQPMTENELILADLAAKYLIVLLENLEYRDIFSVEMNVAPKQEYATFAVKYRTPNEFGLKVLTSCKVTLKSKAVQLKTFDPKYITGERFGSLAKIDSNEIPSKLLESIKRNIVKSRNRSRYSRSRAKSIALPATLRAGRY